jgi:hypothetical protein
MARILEQHLREDTVDGILTDKVHGHSDGRADTTNTVWVWLFVPEAAGRSLETIDKMFDLPWYKIGLYGRRSRMSHEGRDPYPRAASQGGHG